MKTKTNSTNLAGYALMMTMVILATCLVIMAATLNRTMTVAKLNARNAQFGTGLNAAEAAVQKAVAAMNFYFLTEGVGGVTNHLGLFQTGCIPNSAECPFWTNFVFSDGRGNPNETYVQFQTNYTGALPQAFSGFFIVSNYPGQIFRVISNVSQPHSQFPNLTNAVQEDVCLAFLPVFQYCIFYNGLLEFTTCAPLTLAGRVQCNNSLYTGSGSSDPLVFNGLVTCVGTISSPAWAGDSPPFGNTGTFNGAPAPGFITNEPSVLLPLSTNNPHLIIDIPTNNNCFTSLGEQQVYNEASIIILVSNTMVYTNNMTSTNLNQYMSNTTVTVTLQTGAAGLIAAADTSPFTITYTNNPLVATNPVYSIATNLPFLSLNNTFIDNRQSNQVLVSQIDVSNYSSWLVSTSSYAINSNIQAKFYKHGLYPTVLYVADNRAVLSTQFNALRLTNGAALPTNGGLGFTVCTPDSLYVWGTYNCPNSAYIGSSNTSAAGAVPAALMSDALTILSSSWKDTYGSSVGTVPINSTNQVNAAILTGNVPSTGSSASQYSGGVHNITRLLENWGNATLSLNTSIVNLFASQRATNQFQFPTTYYTAPKSRLFYYDLDFINPAKMPPPATPYLSVFMRAAWATPPPGVTNYNVPQ
jgi:hypothetical protein